MRKPTRRRVNPFRPAEVVARESKGNRAGECPVCSCQESTDFGTIVSAPSRRKLARAEQITRRSAARATNAVTAGRARFRIATQGFSRSGSAPRKGIAWKSRLKLRGGSPKGVFPITVATSRSVMARWVLEE
ncbi:MAG: hypothetical protein JO034_06095 [Singulisphaera sp.]|nr:hypothetical protein [Singulisphaera sp.]